MYSESKDRDKIFDENMYKLMTHLYFNIFTLFNEQWVKQKKGIMEFNQFLDDIYGLSFSMQLPAIMSKYETEKWEREIEYFDLFSN